MKTPQIKCVIFDMDGTLVDSENVFVEGYRRAFERRNIDIELSEIQSWTGKSAESTLAKIDKYTNHRYVSEIMRMERKQYFTECFEQGLLKLKPYAKQTLEFCRENGLKVGLATSTFEALAIEVLHHFGIYELFDFHVFGDHVPNLKPQPEIYHRAISRSGIARTACLAVEDSESGVEAALSARIKVAQLIDVTHNHPAFHSQAMKHITSLDQLKLVLMEMNEKVKIFS